MMHILSLMRAIDIFCGMSGGAANDRTDRRVDEMA